MRRAGPGSTGRSKETHDRVRLVRNKRSWQARHGNAGATGRGVTHHHVGARLRMRQKKREAEAPRVTLEQGQREMKTVMQLDDDARTIEKHTHTHARTRTRACAWTQPAPPHAISTHKYCISSISSGRRKCPVARQQPRHCRPCKPASASAPGLGLGPHAASTVPECRRGRAHGGVRIRADVHHQLQLGQQRRSARNNTPAPPGWRC